MKEYRPVVMINGRPTPHYMTYPKPDINWKSYFTTLRPSDVVRWEVREVTYSPWVTYEE